MRDALSVIMPIYNSGRFASTILSSLTEQLADYPETEIIVVDDGSDESLVWLDYFPVKIIRLPHSGVSAARNAGLDAASGHYISFVDSDDDVARNYLHTIYQVMRGTSCDYALYDWWSGDVPGAMHEGPINNWAVWAWSFTRECIGNERFDENMLVAEDVDWLRRVITPEKKRYYCHDRIYRYQWGRNNNSLSQRFNRGEIKVRKI